VSGRVLPFEGKVHREVERLLPWFVNGTLDAEEKILVERHLEQCRPCRQESTELREWHAHAAHDADDAASDAARSWQRLHGRLQALRRQRAARSWWSALVEGWRQSAPWLRWGVVAQSAALVLFGSAQLLIDRPASGIYRTLAATQSAATATGNMVIVFDPHVTEAQMRRLLRVSQARIVDGPNDAGAYVLVVPAGRLAAARTALRAAPGVTLVESLAAGDEE